MTIQNLMLDLSGTLENIKLIDFAKIIPDVSVGKYDFGGAGITITEERKEQVYFSEPNYSGGVVMVVRK